MATKSRNDYARATSADDISRESQQDQATISQGEASTSDSAAAVQDAASQVAGAGRQAQAAAGDLAGQARQRIVAQLNGQKDRAAATVDNMAQALRQTGQQLDEHGQAPVAGYANMAADQVERVSEYLRQKDVAGLQADAAELARARPALFLTGAFALGWLGARFFKSSSPS